MLSRLVIGLGTGRCGTFTLFRILQAQADTVASHEGFPLPWQRDLAQLWFMLLTAQARCKAGVFSNCSFAWLQYVGAIMGQIPDPKFICLQRPRSAVVESFLKHTPNLNHWTDPASPHWNPNKDTSAIQSIMWPKYNAPKEKAIGHYWEEYYVKAEYFQSRYPDNFRIFDMEFALNTKAGQQAMLEFAGYPAGRRRIFLNRKLNAIGHPKGHLNPEDDYVFPGQNVSNRAKAAG